MACCVLAAFIVMRMVSIHENIQAQTNKITARFGADNTSTCRLKIDGITCPGCVESIESKLVVMPGVRTAKVSQLLSQALIEYFPQDVIVEEFVTTIRDAGFDVERMVENDDWAMNVKNADEARLRQIQDWKTALSWSSMATLAIISIGFLPGFTNLYLNHRNTASIQASLCGVVVGFFGRQIHYESLLALQRSIPDMSLLTSLGTSLAFCGSLYDLWRSRGINSVPRLEAASFESTALLVCVVLGGRLLKSVVLCKSVASFSSLASLMTDTVELVTDDSFDGNKATIAVGQLQVDDRISVGPGDIVPLEGKILHGTGYITDTHVTGEIVPSFRTAGFNVLAGSVIDDGCFVIQITQKRQLTWLQHTLQVMAEGDAKKASVQSLADHISARFSWIILTVAIVSFVQNSSFGAGTWSKAIYRVTAIFLCACPCALGLASPTAIMMSLQLASKNGILIKGGSHAVEAAASINTVLFDKTGTLTSGQLSVFKSELSPYWNSSRDQRLRWWLAVSAAEQGSKHPISRAIKIEAERKLAETSGSSAPAEVVKFKNFLGEGVKTDVRLPMNIDMTGRIIHVIVGTKEFLNSNSVQNLPGTDTGRSGDEFSNEASSEPVTIDSYIAFDGIFAGTIKCVDEVRHEAGEMVRRLKGRGYNVGMMTGGNAAVARSVGMAVGIHPGWIYSDLLPDGKLRKITEIRNLHGPVAMIGDNLNDVQSMSAADFSVAAFVDINCLTAMTADVLLVDDKSATRISHEAIVGLAKIPYLFELSRKTYGKIWQNLVWAIAYNTLAVTSATGMWESWGISLSPFYASLGMSLSSVFILTNSLKLNGVKSLR